MSIRPGSVIGNYSPRSEAVGTDLANQKHFDFAEHVIGSASVWVDSGLKRNLDNFNSACAKSGFGQKLLVIWGVFFPPSPPAVPT